MGTSGAIWDDCSALDRLRSRPPRVMLASLANSRARVAAAAASYHITGEAAEILSRYLGEVRTGKRVNDMKIVVGTYLPNTRYDTTMAMSRGNLR
jgi:hypothetical protein